MQMTKKNKDLRESNPRISHEQDVVITHFLWDSTLSNIFVS